MKDHLGFCLRCKENEKEKPAAEEQLRKRERKGLACVQPEQLTKFLITSMEAWRGGVGITITPQKRLPNLQGQGELEKERMKHARATHSLNPQKSEESTVKEDHAQMPEGSLPDARRS